MARNDAERDFTLKAAIRSILWAQGFSTRLDVLLAYDRDPRGRTAGGKAGLTDLDVLGMRLDPGFRVHTAIADCKTSSGKVPERLFWLAGVGRFFRADSSLLVRSKPLPDHAVPLARNLDITVVGPDDLAILTNTYVFDDGHAPAEVWRDFFAPDLMAEVLMRVARLPGTLADIEHYRESFYWMEPPYVQMQRVLGALSRLAKEDARGHTFELVFADFVWLYAIALWRTCEALAREGLSRLEQGLKVYLSGDEMGLQNLERMQRSFEALARKAGADVTLPVLPPYFRDLHELIVRCIRRPVAVAKIARRAEWLVVGQLVGQLGPPPWLQTRDDALGDKLLGDIARFLVRTCGLSPALLDVYLACLNDNRGALSDVLGENGADGMAAGRVNNTRRPADVTTNNALDGIQPGSSEGSHIVNTATNEPEHIG